VIVEATGVTRFPKKLTPKKMKALADAIHKEGALAAIQLLPLDDVSVKFDVNAFTKDEIAAIYGRYAKAAEVCRDAGFEGVEPHGAHNYLINQFFMPDKNKRTDEYGGSLENRSKFGVEIVKAIKGAVGDSILILYRHTPEGEAYTVEDSLKLAGKLVAAGVDVLDISPAKKEITAALAAPFKKAFKVPVIAVGGMNDPDAAADALHNGRCDLVAIGRAFIADPDFLKKVREERFADIIQCKKCKGCLNLIFQGKKAVCVQGASK
jgi:2,4-dienoyl-CoA reductase (NADPH2)